MLRLDRAVATVAKLGVPAATALGWVNETFATDLPDSIDDDTLNSMTIAQQIRKAARAKHTEDSWAAVARALRNAIRAKQRDALAGYLMTSWGSRTRTSSTSDS